MSEDPKKTAEPDDLSNDTTSFDRRLLIVAFFGFVIVAMCVWRAVTPRTPVSKSGLPELRRPAPPFQLYDQTSSLVKLDAYLHRHTIVIVFYDGAAGPEASKPLTELRKLYSILKAEGIVAFGVSTALPQENRRNSQQPFPFALLSDADATSPKSAHKVWGRFVPPPSLDKPPGTIPGVFVIDRTGLVRWNAETNTPAPEPNPNGIAARLMRG